METSFVRADELRAGQLVWDSGEEHEVLRVRDLSDGRLELTLKSGEASAVEVKMAPWTQVPLIDE